MIRLIESSSAQLRLQEARAFVETHAARGDVWLVGASRGAVDDLARSIAVSAGATIGLHRFSLTQLAARLAAPILAAQGLAPVTYLGSEAVAARATFDAQRDAALHYFAPVARTPGFPRALARTLQELRLANVNSDRLGRRNCRSAGRTWPSCSSDSTSSSPARAPRIGRRSSTRRRGRSISFQLPARQLPASLLLLDVPIDSAVEFEFVRALLVRHRAARTRASTRDRPLRRHRHHGPLKSLGLERELLEQTGTSDLVALRRYLFARSQPPVREPAGDVRLLFRAGRRARMRRDRAPDPPGGAPRRAVRRDRGASCGRRSATSGCSSMRSGARCPTTRLRARLVRPRHAPSASRRPRVPRDPRLRLEHLSARRFAEYLSLAQVPRLDEAAAPAGVRARRRDDELDRRGPLPGSVGRDDRR